MARCECRTRNHRGAVIEQTSHNALLDLDALDLGDEHLDRLALDQAGLRDHALVRHGELGARVTRPCPDQKYESHSDRQQDDAQEQQRRQRPKSDPRPIKDLLAPDKHLVDV